MHKDRGTLVENEYWKKMSSKGIIMPPPPTPPAAAKAAPQKIAIHPATYNPVAAICLSDMKFQKLEQPKSAIEDFTSSVGSAFLSTNCFRFLSGPKVQSILQRKGLRQPIPSKYASPNFGSSLVSARRQPLKDLLGFGPAEIAITAIVALVLFGPETLKSLSKDVGRAAAELKEIPKTFKEGMDEGAESAQVAKMKAIAAEKKKKRDEKLKKKNSSEDEDDNEEDEDNDSDSEKDDN
eukprot:gene31064-37544_t